MQSPRLEPMAVIGAGSWGTALAIQMARAGHPTRLWGRDPAQIEAMRQARCNVRYLPHGGVSRMHSQVVADLREALRGARDALVAVPSHAFRATLVGLEPHLRADTRVAWASKGFEVETGLLPHQVAHEVFGARPGAVLSGPTFAREVGAGLPTAMTVASRDAAFRQGVGIEALRPSISAPIRIPTSSAWKSAAPSRMSSPSARVSPTAWASAPTPAWP